MKWAIVIESDPAIAADLQSILQEADPAIEPQIFPNLAELQVWLTEKIVLKKEDKLGDAAIVLMIGSRDILNKEYVGLLCRLREFLFRRGLAVRETPPAFILTAFDGEKDFLTHAQHEVISNVIFQPFDRAIAIQAIINALNPGKAFSLRTVYAQKSEVMIEALKDVELHRLSEYGFTTLSERSIPIGTITKFHHQIFVTGPRPGIYARCRACQEEEVPGKFVCHFSFFAITSEQVQSVRRFLKTKPKTDFQSSFPFYSESKTHKSVHVTKNLSPKDLMLVHKLVKKENPQSVVIVDADAANVIKIKEVLTRNFSNVTIVEYSSYLDFLLELDPQFTESKKVEKGALPTAESLRFHFDTGPRAIVTTDPVITEPSEILGLDYKTVMNKENFILDRIIPEDRERFLKYLKTSDATLKETFRFQHIAGHRCYIEFQFDKVEADKPTVLVLKVRELAATERLDFLKNFRKFKGHIDTLILAESAMGEAFSDRLKVLATSMETCKVVPENHSQLIVGFAKDPRKLIDAGQGIHPKLTALFPTTFDRSLFLQLCALDENELNSAEIKKTMTYCEVVLTLKASTDVKAEELSEAGIVFKYYREIKPGEFRSFHLPLEVFGKVEEEAELIELRGRCHHSVKIDEKSGYMTYFVLFGMTDIFLKHVRSWMKRHYVGTKKEEAA